MEKIITVYYNSTGHIYFIDNSINYVESDEIPDPDFIMCWEESICLFNELKNYQDKGYKVIFK